MMVTTKKRRIKKMKKGTIAVIVSSSIAAGAILTFGILFAFAKGNEAGFSNTLNNIYTNAFFDLVDNVSSMDTKISKTLVSVTPEYQQQGLVDVATNSRLAEQNMSILPIHDEDAWETHKFFNQATAYFDYLTKQIETVGLSEEQRKIVTDIAIIVEDIKNNLAIISIEIQKGYSIVENVNNVGSSTGFSKVISEMTSNDVEFPTLIFDGPFSDVEFQETPIGLGGEEVSMEQAKTIITNMFLEKQPFELEFLGETKSKFTTFDFRIEKDGFSAVASISKTGGKLITLTGVDEAADENFSIDDAKETALAFAKLNKLENIEVVWVEKADSNLYLNLAPVENNVIMYPDLIKVKVDLATGMLIGFETTGYYMNHTSRTLSSPQTNISAYKTSLENENFNIEKINLCLAPLDYGDEILCFELVANKNNDTYHFFVNAVTGREEKIMKVVKTISGGSLLS